MMKSEFENLAGREVTDEQYRANRIRIHQIRKTRIWINRIRKSPQN